MKNLLIKYRQIIETRLTCFIKGHNKIKGYNYKEGLSITICQRCSKVIERGHTYIEDKK